MREQHPGVFAAVTTALVVEGVVILVVFLACATMLNIAAITQVVP